MELPFRKTPRGVSLTIKVQPRASKNAVSGIVGECVKVQLTAPPVDGEANDKLIEFLADTLDVRRSYIKILKGKSSRNKVVEIEGLTEAKTKG